MGDMIVAPQENSLALVSAETAELVIGKGDLKTLTPQQRVEYIGGLCRSMGLNPLTRPFQIMDLGGKTVLYATKDCTDQLRRKHAINLAITGREKVEDVWVVTARATDKTGREDESIGAVSVANLRGEALANALMKAETKAKRRAALSICGLGFLDETEVETIQSAPLVPAGSPPPPPVQERSALSGNLAHDLQLFAAIKESIGAEAYYRILGDYGVEHANEIKSLNKRKQAYTEMLAVQGQQTVVEAEVVEG